MKRAGAPLFGKAWLIGSGAFVAAALGSVVLIVVTSELRGQADLTAPPFDPITKEPVDDEAPHTERVQSRLILSAIGLAVLCTTGCDTAAPLEGHGPLDDCVARIGYAGSVYRPNSNLRESAPPGRALGQGTEVDCDGSALDLRVRVHAIRGIPPTKAIIVTGHSGMRGIYIEVQLHRSEWPAALRRP
jgi:hypothetical protein